jgi:hypothetical protein
MPVAQVEVAAAAVKPVAAKAPAPAPAAAMFVEQKAETGAGAGAVASAAVGTTDAMPMMAAPHEDEEAAAPAHVATPPTESAVLEADVAHILAEAMARTHRVQQQRSQQHTEQRTHSGLKGRLHAQKHALGARHSAEATAHAEHGARHTARHATRHHARRHRHQAKGKVGDAHDDLVLAARQRAMALMNAANGADRATADMSAAYSGPMAPPAPETEQARAEAARARRRVYGEQSRRRSDDIHRFMATAHATTHDMATLNRLLGEDAAEGGAGAGAEDAEAMSEEDLAAVDAELDEADQSLDESEGGLDEALLSAVHMNEDETESEANGEAETEAEGEAESTEATDAVCNCSRGGSTPPLPPIERTDRN